MTPYYNIIYSFVNNKYLKYTLENPKGKYEIKLNVINDNSSLEVLYDQLNLKMKYKEQDVYYMVTI